MNYVYNIKVIKRILHYTQSDNFMKLEDKCKSLLKQQLNPREISDKLGIDINEVMNFLYIQIGKGNIKRSDILFSFNKKIRSDYEKIISLVTKEDINRKKNYICEDKDLNDDWKKLFEEIIREPSTIELNKLDRDEIEWDDTEGLVWDTIHWESFIKLCNEFYGPGVEPDLDLFKIYFDFRKRKAWIEDLYSELFYSENSFHMIVWWTLSGKYGEEWWEKIHPEVRNKCKERKGKKSSLLHPFNYSDLIHLSKIIRHQWDDFSIFFQEKHNKTSFKSFFAKVNNIRNKVMHPIRELPTINDLETVHQFYLYSKEILIKYDQFLQRERQ